MNETAVEPFVRFGTEPVSRLVRVAVGRKNRRPYRLRALAVSGRIGKLSCPEDLLDSHPLLLE